MMEEQPVNTILATLHATDADSTISEYQLIDGDGDNGSEYFEINNVTGKQKHSSILLILLFHFVHFCVPRIIYLFAAFILFCIHTVCE